MVAGADGDALVAEDLRHIVRLHARDVERDDPAAPLGGRPVDGDAFQLLEALRKGERTTVERLLKQSPTAARASGSAGITPLMHAALYRDLAIRRMA